MSVEEHIAALLEGDRAARDIAARLLRGLRFDPLLLVPVLQHHHVSRQVKAIELLRYSRTREAVELLVGMLASSHELVGKKAASRLGNIGAIAPEVIAGALDTAMTPAHRLNILDALSRLQHPRGREALIVHADAWSPHHRIRALDYLRRYGRDAPVETIRAALSDPDTKYTAADVAGRLRDPSFIEPMVAICLESDDWAAWEARSSLSKFGMAALEPLLARAGDPALHRGIASALGRLVWRIEEGTFWALWSRNIPPLRDVCIQHLASHSATSYDRARCMAALAEHVHDENRNRRIWCIHAYERHGAIDALQAMTSDPDEAVRHRAESALRALANRQG